MTWEIRNDSAPCGGIDQRRVVEKLDDYMSRRDYAGAERHLLYWLDEALALGDRRGELLVRNELIGHFRKTGDGPRALENARAALQLVDDLDFGDTISAGTTYVNAATACSAFGDDERAYELFGKAMEVYEASAATAPHLIGGLCNNRAIACVALGRFDEADALYQRALEAMCKVKNGELEQAITYLNMADAVVARARARERACGQAGSALRGGEAPVMEEPRGAVASGPLPESAGMPDGAPADASEKDAPAAEDPFDLVFDEACEARVEKLLDTAFALLDEPHIPRDGYYAFVCEKCAPTFARYGYFLADAELRGRAQAIYGGTTEGASGGVA